MQKSKDLKNLFRSCSPPDFTSDDEPIIWKAYDIMLVKYGKMRANNYSQSQQASSRPNGGSDSTDDFSTRQAVKVAHLVAANNGGVKKEETS